MWTCHWSMATYCSYLFAGFWNALCIFAGLLMISGSISTISVTNPTQLNLDSSPTASIVVAIKTFCFSDENVPLVAAGKGLANLSKYSASYFSEKKGFKTIFFTADSQLYTNACQWRIYKNTQQWDLLFFFHHEKFPLFTGKLYLSNPY